MQLRSGRRLVSPPPAPRGDPRRGRRRRLPRGGGGGDDGDGEREDADRISDLPEELLLDVLARLGCVREAARTSALSRRWRDRGLWAELRDMRLEAAGAGALEAALARVRPNLHRLDIQVDVPRDGDLTGAQISSLLRAADRLAPSELAVSLFEDGYSLIHAPVEVPCFRSATSIDLDLQASHANLRLAPAGEFALLQQLTLTLQNCVVDIGALVSRCPRLRKLSMDIVRCHEMDIVRCHEMEPVAIESRCLEELKLVMYTRQWSPPDVAIVAPGLKKLHLGILVKTGFTLSHSVPKLEELVFYYTCQNPCVGLGYRWQLRSFTMKTEWSDRNESHPHDRVTVLFLGIYTNSSFTSPERSFAQEVARLSVHVYTDLRLRITTGRHVYGPLLLHLLLMETSIKRLKLDLPKNFFPECPGICDCDEDGNWRNQQISLPRLEDVEIEGFTAEDHEVDFLQLVFRSAPMLKRMNVNLSDEVSPSGGGCQKLRSIFEEHAYVKCNVYGGSDDDAASSP